MLVTIGTYRKICCIMVCILHILRFSVLSIILAYFHRKYMFTCTSSKGHGLSFVIGGSRSVLFVSY